MEHVLTVDAASIDVNEDNKPSIPVVSKCSGSTDTFAEKSVGVVRFVYGEDGFLVPYADGAVTTMRELLEEVSKKINGKIDSSVVYCKDGSVCDIDRSVKECIDGCGGSISFVLSK